MLLTTVGIILGLVFAVKIISALVKFFHKIHLQKKQAAEISGLNEMQSLNIAATPEVEEMPPKTELLDSSSISSADLTELADKTILNSEVNHYYVDNITADNYFIEAGELVTERQRASVGHLQRALRIGFDRANINTTPSDNVELESLEQPSTIDSKDSIEVDSNESSVINPYNESEGNYSKTRK